MDVETFPNAPIKEALIDIRVSLPKTVGGETLESLHNHIRDLYPNKKERRIWEGSLQLSPDQPILSASKDRGVNGFLFISENKNRIVQFKKDGFTYHCLRPYTTWDEMRSEASRLWNYFWGETKPTLITRLSVRYINVIEIPLMKFDLDEFFNAPPSIPSELPQVMENFLTRYTLNFSEENAKSIVTLSTPGNIFPDKSQIYFDIDVFRDIEIHPPFDGLWEKFEELRNIKNTIFFKSITEKTKDLFR